MTNEFGVYLTEDEVRMMNALCDMMEDRRHAMEGGLSALVEVLTARIAILSIALQTPHMG